MCLCVYVSICLCVYVSMCLCVYVSIGYLSMCLCVYLSISLSLCLSLPPSFPPYLPMSLSTSVYLSILSSCLSETMQFRETSSNMDAHSSKTKQFCQTSSMFKVGNIKNESILRDFLQTWKVECRVDGLVPMRLAIFPLHLPKVLRLPRKSDARSYEVLHLSRKIISANLKS